MTDAQLAELLRPHVKRIAEAAVARHLEREAGAHPYPAEPATFAAGAAAFAPADARNYASYFADTDGMYPEHMHAYFGCGPKEFADHSGLVRKQITDSLGRRSWRWVRRDTGAPATPQAGGAPAGGTELVPVSKGRLERARAAVAERLARTRGGRAVLALGSRGLKAAHAIEHYMLIAAKKTQAVAVEAAEERGLPPEKKDKLRAALYAADFLGGYVTGAAAGAVGGVLAAKAAMLAPSASAFYLLYSTARNPLATLRAARKVLRETFDRTEPAAAHAAEFAAEPFDIAAHVGEIADAVEAAPDADDWFALFCVALAEAEGDVSAAVELANAANHHDEGPEDGGASTFSDGDPIEEMREVVGELPEEETDGLYVYAREGPQFWIDQMDWHEGDGGKKVIAAAKKLAGVRKVQDGVPRDDRGDAVDLGNEPAVFVLNEGPKPPGDWEKLLPAGSKFSEAIDEPDEFAAAKKKPAPKKAPAKKGAPKKVQKEVEVTIKKGPRAGATYKRKVWVNADDEPAAKSPGKAKPEPKAKPKKADPKEVADGIRSALADPAALTPEKVEALKALLDSLTVPQIKALKAEQGLKGGKTKADHVKSLVDRASELGKAQPAPKDEPAAEPAPAPEPAAPEPAPQPAPEPVAPPADAPRPVPAYVGHPVARTLADGLNASVGLTDAQRDYYAAASKRVLEGLPGPALDRIAENLSGVRFHPSTQAILDGVLAEMASKGAAPDALARAREALAGKNIGGLYANGYRSIHVDGDHDLSREDVGAHGWGKVNRAAGVYAHEVSHALDGPEQIHSRSAAWARAFDEEIAHTGDRRARGEAPRLSIYAASRPSEGFAEFGRLVYGSDVPHAQIAKEFPKATAYFKAMDWWPAEERIGGAGGGLAEVFDKAVPVGDDGKAHVDTLRPGAAPHSDDADAIEMSEEELARFDAESAAADADEFAANKAKPQKVLKSITVKPKKGKPYQVKRLVNVEGPSAAKGAGKAEPPKAAAKPKGGAGRPAPKKGAPKKEEPKRPAGAKGKAAPRVKERPVSEKAARAKQAHVMVGKTVQRYAEEYIEPLHAKLLGGASFPDSEPCDLKLGGDEKTGAAWAKATADYHKAMQEWRDAGGATADRPKMAELKGAPGGLVELKTVVVGGNDKITMDSYAQVRKVLMERESGATYHTIVVDDRAVYDPETGRAGDESQRVYYYRRGVAGSARLFTSEGTPNLLVCNGIEELKAAMALPDEELPAEARRTDEHITSGNWKFFQDAAGKGYKDKKSGRIVRAKK